MNPSLAAALLVSLATPLQDDDVEGWAEDLFQLADRLEEMHPSPWHACSRAEFEEAVDALYQVLPDLTEDQRVVEAMRLFALHGRAGKEGHCGIFPRGTFSAFPVRLYRFEDGWFVVEANAEFEDLLGAQVLSIGGRPVDEIGKALAPLMCTDNDTNLLGRIPSMLYPEVLHALGLTSERGRAVFRIAAEGAEREVTLAGVRPGRRDMRLPADPNVLWLSDRRKSWWLKALPEREALYVQFNETLGVSSDGQALSAFAQEITRTFEAEGLERVVIDVRLNGGGNNTTFGPLITALAAHPGINRKGALYCLTGRATFSAAGNFVTVIERDTEAILVGEPTGGGPNQFGDAQNVMLENHPELVVRISTRFHEFDPERADRLTHEPHVAVGLTARDYFAGEDPVLERALAHEGP